VSGPDPDRAWLERVRHTLDESAEGLDPVLRARLRAARSAALERRPRRLAWWWPVAGLASAAVATGLVLWLAGPGTGPAGDGGGARPIDVLLAEDYELVTDLEFYTWLEEEQREKPDAG